MAMRWSRDKPWSCPMDVDSWHMVTSLGYMHIFCYSGVRYITQQIVQTDTHTSKLVWPNVFFLVFQG